MIRHIPTISISGINHTDGTYNGTLNLSILTLTSDEGGTLSITGTGSSFMTPNSGTISAGNTTLTFYSDVFYDVSINVTDSAGNNSNTLGIQFTRDTSIPTISNVSLSSSNAYSNSHATFGDTITLDFSGNEDLYNVNVSFNLSGISVSPGNNNTYRNFSFSFLLDNNSQADIGITYTINFEDIGNTGVTVTGGGITYDNTVPTVTNVSFNPLALTNNNNTPTVTITFSEEIGGSGPLIVAPNTDASGGPIPNSKYFTTVNNDRKVWEGTFTADASNNSINNLTIKHYRDYAGNVGNDHTSTIYTIDTNGPTVSVDRIGTSIYSEGGPPAVDIYATNDSTPDLVFTSSESGIYELSSNFTNQFGDVSGSVSQGSNTITLSLSSPTHVLGGPDTDHSGNITVYDTGGNSTFKLIEEFRVTTSAIQVTQFDISTNSLNFIRVTSVITIKFNKIVIGFSNTDISSPDGYVDISSNDYITWTGTFTPNQSTESNVDRRLTITGSYTDIAGVSGPTGADVSSNVYRVDTVSPTVNSFTISDSVLITGETDTTVTLVFSEQVLGFNSDIDISGSHGTLSTMTSNDNITWEGTFTPNTNTEADGILLLNDVWTDRAGNNGITTNYQMFETDDDNVINFTIDTLRPSGVISISKTTFNRSDLSTGATLTIQFNELIDQSSFNYTSLDISNGSLENNSLITYDNGRTWTATFLPDENIESSTNRIVLIDSRL